MKLSQEAIQFQVDNTIKLTYTIGDFTRGGQYAISAFKLTEIFQNNTFVNNQYMMSIIKDEKLRGYLLIMILYMTKYKKNNCTIYLEKSKKSFE